MSKEIPMPLRWSDYSQRALDSNQFGFGPEAARNFRFGYFGQVGSLVSAVKKSERDARGESLSSFALEEIGDALWYLAALAAAFGVEPGDLGAACIHELQSRFTANRSPDWSQPSFRQVDGIIAGQRDGVLPDRETALRDVAYQAGVLLQEDDRQLDFRHVPHRDKRLGQLAAGLALAAERLGGSLEAAAETNLEKIRRRWPGPNRQYHPLFDDAFPSHEQFPRRLEIDFIERGGPDRPVVFQSISGVFVGDRLTDNIVEGDGYRFHDVFHLAYVAYLGWSPVTRGLLKRKRKSSSAVDENEDGARATIIEEGIATWIFNHAKAHDFYSGITEGRLDYGLLKQIDQMVRGYEVEKVSLWQWEQAILNGMAAFRSLLRNRGGRIVVDMVARTLEYMPLAVAEP